MKNKDLLTLTHAGENPQQYAGAVSPPVFLNSLHLFDSFEDYLNYDDKDKEQFIYGRVSNPTTVILEEKIAELEHGKQALAFASGMAAASAAILGTCKAGSHIICLRDVYQPVKRFIDNYCIPILNMSVTYVDGTDVDEIENSITDKTDLIILESPATFVFTVFDLKAIAKVAKKHGVKTYIDNTYCTPIYQKPLDLGIDIVMHTLSKYIGGHSDIIGGILVSNDEKLMKRIHSEIREWVGGIIGPMEAWLAIRGLRTLEVRVARHWETAQNVAEYLEKHPKVEKVYYSGLESHPQKDLIKEQQTGHTGLMSFELKCDESKIPAFLNSLEIFGIGCSWGGFESLALAPLYKSTTQELEFLKLPSGKKLVRIHCGLEGSENLIADLEQALDKV